ncbi:unnamed protein product [Linum trigynum]|uniref:Uncharacterized protein n=1 Tax=Linum trigynum TaxID=586398 RepID=A0AAV2EUN6_9ROSI
MVQAIRAIPIRSGEADELIWQHSSNGEYTVKEGYRVWLEQSMAQKGVQGSSEGGFWKKLWSMKVPPKVRHFLWKFANDILPTGDRVSRKSDRWSEKCPFCDDRETQLHAFVECAWGSRIWRQSQCADLYMLHDGGTTVEWLKKAREKAGEDWFEEWSVLLWFLWKERNAQLFNGLKTAEEEIVQRAKIFLDDYREHQERRIATQRETGDRKWRKPPTGRVMVNTDAGILQEGGIGLGVVMRDENGSFVLATAKRVKGEFTVEMAEALALEMRAQLVQQFHVQNPIMATDCLQLVHLLTETSSSRSEVGVLCRNIRRLVDERQGSFSHVYREANEAAHILAHARTRWDERVVWLDRPPICIVDQVSMDNVAADSI